MSTLPVTKAVVKGLADFLGSTMPAILKVEYNFPEANSQLVYPCLTVFTRSPEFRAISPYVIEKGNQPDANNQFLVKRVVGIYDFSLQVDLWSEYKAQREELYQQLFDAFLINPDVPGINLKMENYHNMYASFSLQGAEFMESEESSQRKEWRVMARVVGNCRAVSQSLAYLMEEIENNLETPNVVEAPEEEDPAQII